MTQSHFKPKLDKLIKKAHLTNPVARTALKNAGAALSKKPSDTRCAEKELHIVLTQIAEGRCQIAPLQWRVFCEVYNEIKEFNYETFNSNRP